MFPIYLINFLLAISTTIGMTIIPFLITDSLGLSLLILGLIEGSTEFLSNCFRLLNGVLFDKIKNKRTIFVCSTGLAFISKLVLLIFNPWAILGSKILERISNGTFASPRDAYIAANAKDKGIALAFLNVTKALGCILGPLIVSVSTIYLGNLRDNLHFFILLSCSLSFPAFLLSHRLNIKEIPLTPFSFKEIKGVFKKITPVLVLSFLFFLGRFNDGILMMYLKEKGFPEWFYLSTIAIFNSIMIISSPIVGKLIDRNYMNIALYIAIGCLAVYNVCFFNLEWLPWPLAIIGLLGWGIQRSAGQIVCASLVFRSVSKENYGTAIGLFYVLSGFASMLSSFLSGYLANYNFKAIFVFSGLFAFLALCVASMLLSKGLGSFKVPLITTQ